MSFIDNIQIRKIICDFDSTKVLVSSAEQFGKFLTSKDNNLSTSQIRALFGEVRQIQGQWETDNTANRQKAVRRLYLLKPKMAYRAKKERGKGVEELVEVLDTALDFVLNEENQEKQDENFKRFVEFFEAILAYHKAYGGN